MIDLCCGAGGWSALLDPRLHHVTGFDNNTDARHTHQASGHPALHADLAHYPPWNAKVDGLVASPPCQGYSVAGLRAGRDDPRSGLVGLISDWTFSTHPQWVLAEQVEDALPAFRREAAKLSLLDYRTWVGVLRSEQYGVPQTRTRAVLMAHKDVKPTPPPPTHSRYYPHTPTRMDEGVLPWVTLAQALEWEGEVGWARKNDRPDGHTHRQRDIQPVERPAVTLTGKARSWVHKRPSPTVVGSFQPQIIAKPDYRMTVRRQDQEGSVQVEPWQAGILQGFPPTYPWQGSRTSKFQQIGNAIPPPLAMALLKQIGAL
jgi:DNA (cytosine-5)-methyltransferase 1